LLLLGSGGAIVVLEHFLAEVDALVADEYAGARNQLPHLVLALPAEAAAGVATAVFSFVHWSFFVSLGRCWRRGIMAPQNLVGKAYALAANEDSRAGDETDASFALILAAERALGTVSFDLVALRPASEDHPAATFSFSFSVALSLSVALSFSPGLVGVRMMSSISPYSFAASAVRKYSRSVSCVTFSIFWPVCRARIWFSCSRVRRISLAWIWMSVACPCMPPHGWWMRMLACGRAKRWPCAPPASSTAAIEYAIPMHMVDTGGRMYCMVS